MAVAIQLAALSGLPPLRYRRTRLDEIVRARGLRMPWVAKRMVVLHGQRPITPAFVERACRAFDLPEEALFFEPVERAGE